MDPFFNIDEYAPLADHRDDFETQLPFNGKLEDLSLNESDRLQGTTPPGHPQDQSHHPSSIHNGSVNPSDDPFMPSFSFNDEQDERKVGTPLSVEVNGQRDDFALLDNEEQRLSPHRVSPSYYYNQEASGHLNRQLYHFDGCNEEEQSTVATKKKETRYSPTPADNHDDNSIMDIDEHIETAPAQPHAQKEFSISVCASSQFGDYRMGQLLGKGGFGSVYHATKEHDGRHDAQHYAIKVMEKGQMSQLELSFLMREIDVSQSVHHVNVIGCIDVVHSNDRLGIVQELCYKDLCGFVNDNGYAFTHNLIQQIMKGLVSGLQYLHSNGIVHLDIKPENVLVRRKAAPEEMTSSDFVICDLGMCQQGDAEAAVVPHMLCGTPGFYGPELMMKCIEYDGRMSDMWSTGCTLVELAYGLSSDWFAAYDMMQPEHGGGDCIGFLEDELYLIHNKEERGSRTLHDLACSLLVLDPTKRLTASDALRHPFLMGK